MPPHSYLEDINAQVEEAFQAEQPQVEVNLVGRAYVVKFMPGSSFALQKDDIRYKERTIRRVVKTVQVACVRRPEIVMMMMMMIVARWSP